MRSIDKLSKLANKFEQKLSLAYGQSAQKGDIDSALQKAGVRPSADDISPFLDKAHVPDSLHLSIGINVGSNLGVQFVTAPRQPLLESLLNKIYSSKMQNALKNSGLGVADNVYVGLANF